MTFNRLGLLGLFLLGLSFLILGGTQFGFNLSLKMLDDYFPQVQVNQTQSHGTWLGHFSIHEAVFHIHGMSIHVDTLSGQDIWFSFHHHPIQINKVSIDLPYHQSLILNHLTLALQFKSGLQGSCHWENMIYTPKPKLSIKFPMGEGTFRYHDGRYKFQIDTQKNQTQNQLSLAGDGNNQTFNLKKINFQIISFMQYLQRHPILGSGTLTFFPHHIKVTRFNINAGDSSLKFDGDLNQNWDFNWDFNWDIHVPHLNDLIPNARGEINSRGVIKGPTLLPEIDMTAIGNEICIDSFKVAHLDETLHFFQTQPSSLILNIEKLSIGHTQIAAIHFTATGTLKQQSIAGHAQISSTHRLDFSAEGHYQSGQWIGQLTQLTLKDKQMGNLHLTNPAQILIQPGQFSLKPIALSLLNQKLVGELNWTHAGWSMHVATPGFNAKLLSAFFPRVSGLTGLMSMDMTLITHQHISELSGFLTLTHGNFRLPEFNTQINNIHITLKGLQHSLLIFGKAMMGGPLTLTGNLNFWPVFKGHIELDGQHLLLSNTPQFYVQSSSHLIFLLDEEKLAIQGDVFIPHAKLNPVDLDEPFLTTSDIVFITPEKREPAKIAPIEFTSKIHLSLGQDVNINLMGLSGKVSGNLILIDNPHAETVATGALYLNEVRYKYFGQNLTVRPGAHLIYANTAVDNPLINFKAVREIKTVSPTGLLKLSTPIASLLPNSASPLTDQDQVTAGIYVQGSLKNPKITLFSEPAGLSQMDILAYVLLGHSAKEASLGDGQLLLNAAASMNSGTGGQFSQVVDQITKTFGIIDHINVESSQMILPGQNDTIQNTSLVLSKTLSPKLFVNYSIGLIAPINILQIKYELSKNLTIQGSNSTFTGSSARGADILYKIEK